MDSVTIREKKKLSNTTRIVLVYVISILLGAVLAPVLAKLYIALFKPSSFVGSIAFNVDRGNLSGGFLIAYTFFLSLLVVILDKKKHRFWVWFIGIILFLLILIGEWDYFGFVLLLSLTGYLIGLGISWLQGKIKEKGNQPN
jgi:hypothetical protein